MYNSPPMRRLFLHTPSAASLRKILRRSLSYSQQAETEIERKFKPTPKSEALINSISLSKRDIVFTDIYFDHASYALTTKDMWLRKRSQTIELKSPITEALGSANGMVGVDFYHETRELSDIARIVKDATLGGISLPPPPSSTTDPSPDLVTEWLASAGLVAFAQIDTRRTRYLVELPARHPSASAPPGKAPSRHRLHVDIDEVDFAAQGQSYKIGEIELIEAGGGLSPVAALVDAFQQLQISPATVRGKVLEFLFRFAPRHYQALEASGLIGSKLGAPPAPSSDAAQADAAAQNGKEPLEGVEAVADVEAKLAGEVALASEVGGGTVSPAQMLLGKSAANYHFTRKCNYSCKFCFHTALTSSTLSLERSVAILGMLREAGAEKINFAGGEPFLREYQPLLGALVRASKEMGFQSVSIISNGSMSATFPAWFAEFGAYLDILGISLDTVNPATNFNHGRHAKGARKENFTPSREHQDKHLVHVRRAAEVCSQYGVKFKINTVVTSLNSSEDMSFIVNELRPMRWKIFQMLPLLGENCGPGAINNAEDLAVSADQFQAYVSTNTRSLWDASIVEAESNDAMRSSYILIDEAGRFLDSSGGGKVPTSSILDVGLDAAAAELMGKNRAGFDRSQFLSRGGYYPEEWTADR